MIETEVLIVGAGPCGLFAVFELGLLGIRAHVVETLNEPGGQCAILYPEKPIYDIPALPVVGASELIERLLEQIAPFDAPLHLNQEVSALRVKDDGRLYAATSGGLEFDAGAVVIAGGLGSFQPRPLRVPAARSLPADALHYRVTDRARFAGRRLVILGGGDSALDWFIDLAAITEAVTLIHRRDSFRAAPASVARMHALAEAEPERFQIRIGKVTDLEVVDTSPCAVDFEAADGGARSRIACDDVLVFYGLRPSLGPIAEWGLDIEKRQLLVEPSSMATSVPSIFAIGDVSTYKAKKKLILTGFHEAAVAAYAVQAHLYPDIKQSVQYTTTSSALQSRLGVGDGASATEASS